MTFNRCARCGNHSFERFAIYGVCHDCNYFELKRNRKSEGRFVDGDSRNKCVPQGFRGAAQNKFTEKDHKIIRRALLAAPEGEQKIILLHFWNNRGKDDIAEKLEITVSQVEEILSRAYERLKELCLRDPKFSRAMHAAKIAA